jgi:SEL1 protein
MWDVNKFGPYSTSSTGNRDPRTSSTPSKKSSTTPGGGGDEFSSLGYYDAKLDKNSDKVDDQTQMVAGIAAGYLGRMFLRGEGVNVNFQKAFLWFKRGTTRADRESHNGLGIMYRDGLGVERNLKTAIMHFHAAAQQDLAEAQVNLGKYHFGMGETVLATTFFEAAIRSDGIRQPDTFQSYYYLAELASSSASPSNDNCPVTVSFYKHVAERGDWDHEVWWEAERSREKGDLRRALLGYWIMAERGYEVAQNNVAWILDRGKFPTLHSFPARL